LSTAPAAQPPAQWPAQAYPNQTPQAGYHFPPPDPDPNYGYNQQAYPPQQWGQQGDQRGYDLASYMPSDPPPFQQTAHRQQPAYDETEADYGDELFEDEEPRRGRRWIFIAAALVGAIGVGGALAYTYRSIVAPTSGRVPLVKAEPNVKVKPEQRGGKEFPGTERKLPNRLEAAALPPKAEQEPPASEEPAAPGENLGPRAVKTIPIGSQPASAQPPPVAAVPGITLQNLPPSRAEPPPQAAPKTAQPPPARLTVGQPPPAEADDDPPPPPPAARRPPAVQNPPPQAVARAAPPRAAPQAPSSGLGYVVVLASKKTHMDAIKAYADVHEKHAQVLSGKTPDVQEADLGEKGVFFRAVVGPPVSREAAMSLCGQLKAAGQDCWVKAY
jgi:hypothetical protein